MRIDKGVLLIILTLSVISCTSHKNPQVEMLTEYGSIVVELYADKAPVSSENFLYHIDKGTFDGAVFYRSVKDNNQEGAEHKINVLQGGLYADSLIDVHPGIKHETTQETGILHKNGVISMARYGPGTACTEFFFCIGDQPSLDYGGMRNPDGQGFSAFGKVTKGMDVIRKIHSLPDTNQYFPRQVAVRIKRLK